ncbi:MAG TPA: hypothetical protein PKJ98_11370 [Verrucomicrobiota bacterium]|nr:hypothetical protein [Verrucomicrobiota bacterium]
MSTNTATANQALDLLRRYVPRELYIPERLADKTHFTFWLDDDPPLYGVPGAVHEGLHHLDSQWSDFDQRSYSVDQSTTLTVPRVPTFPRSAVAAHLPPDQHDDYHREYLTGKCGAQGFDSLLEELNAYTHGCRAAAALHSLYDKNVQVSERDGLASFMLYLLLYLKHAHDCETATWRLLTEDRDHAALVLRLWTEAELVLAEAVCHPFLGIRDRAKRRHLATPDTGRWLDLFRQAAAAQATAPPFTSPHAQGSGPEVGPLRPVSRSRRKAPRRDADPASGFPGP